MFGVFPELVVVLDSSGQFVRTSDVDAKKRMGSTECKGILLQSLRDDNFVNLRAISTTSSVPSRWK